MNRWFDLWHPSSQRLRAWLETGEPDGVGDHVEQCDRCADRLVELDRQSDEPDGPTSSLRQALQTLFTPPDDLNERVLDGVEQRRHAGDDLRLLGEMLSIGIETAQLMLADDDPNRPDGGDERSTTAPPPVPDDKDHGS